MVRSADNLLWIGWSEGTDPYYVVQRPTGEVVHYDALLSGKATLATSEMLKPDQLAVWEADQLLSFAVVNGDTVNVLTQYDSSMANGAQFTPSIPIANDILSVSGLPNDQQQATLFVVNADSTLSVLAKGPTLGAWTSTPVQQASASLQEMSTWRTQLSVVDANGVPVVQTGMKITPAGRWGVAGHRQRRDGPGEPGHQEHRLARSGDLRHPCRGAGYRGLLGATSRRHQRQRRPAHRPPRRRRAHLLAGSAGLNDMDPLTGSSLVKASNADGTAMFPVLAKLTGDDRTNCANAVASAVNQSMLAGQSAPSSDIKAFTLDLSGAVPTYQPSRNPKAFRLLKSSNWMDKAKHDLESVYHGIRHGLIKVEKATMQWSDDAQNWVVNLAITIGDDVSDAISYAITDVKSPPFDVVALIGPLLRLIGINDQVTRSYIAALVIAYPATVAYAISNSNQPLFPTAGGDYGPGLKFTAAVAQYT